MKRFGFLIGLILTLMIVLFLNSCGGGAGDDYTPPGINPGQPAELRLYPDRNVVQTGAYVSLRAFLIDANGRPVSGQVVNFTNLSIYGILSSTTAVTDDQGVAKVEIRSTTDGIATIVAENSGLRDRRSVVFTSNDTINGLAIFPVTVQMDVDGDGDGVYNEPEDLNMLQGSGDDTILVRATVSVFGQLVVNAEVTFTTDFPDDYAYFPFGTDTDNDGKGDYLQTYTNSAGQAYATIKVEAGNVFSSGSYLNIFAQTESIYVPEFDSYFIGYGATSVFLEPVVIADVSIYATPDVVTAGGTSTLTIGVSLSTGYPAPDGTVVQLSATCGAIDKPFVQTQNGVASATFTAPSEVAATTVCTVTAAAGGVEDSVNITVNP
jgi:hypothetical protein